MSSANLQRFLEYLVTDMTKRDPNFRTAVANRSEHVFATSARRIVTQTITELHKRTIKVSIEEEKQLYTSAKKAFRAISIKVQKSLTNHEKFFNIPRHKSTRFTSSSLVAIYQVPNSKNSDIFSKVKRTYEVALNEYFFDVHTIFLNQNKKLGNERGKFFQAGHAQDSGVFELNISQAVNSALQKIDDPDLLKFAGSSKTKVAATLRAVMSKDSTNMKIFIESAKANRADQSKVIIKKNKFIASAEAAIAKITSGKGFTSFKGSDSPMEAKKKDILRRLVREFDKVKGAKVTSKNTKPNPSKKEGNLSIDQKITRAKIALDKQARTSNRRKVDYNDNNLVTILADINARLHNVLQKRMVLPNLVYRSGQFARSVEVTHVNKTLKGFTRINYTYDPKPYGVFDTNTGLYNQEKDPEFLVDKSIREIVAGRLGIRFFTKRSW